MSSVFCYSLGTRPNYDVIHSEIIFFWPKTLTLLRLRVVFNNVAHRVLCTDCWCGNTRQWLRGSCKMTELQSAGRCNAVACSGVTGSPSCDVLIQHQEVLSILMDCDIWASYGLDDETAGVTSRSLPHFWGTSYLRLHNARLEIHFREIQGTCSVDIPRTLDHDMITAVLRIVAGFVNISTTKRGKRIYVKKM